MSEEIETILHLFEISYCSNCELVLDSTQTQILFDYINNLQQEKQDLINYLESKNKFHYLNGKVEDNYILVSEVLNKVRSD